MVKFTTLALAAAVSQVAARPNFLGCTNLAKWDGGEAIVTSNIMGVSAITELSPDAGAECVFVNVPSTAAPCENVEVKVSAMPLNDQKTVGFKVGATAGVLGIDTSTPSCGNSVQPVGTNYFNTTLQMPISGKVSLHALCGQFKEAAGMFAAESVEIMVNGTTTKTSCDETAAPVTTGPTTGGPTNDGSGATTAVLSASVLATAALALFN